MAPRSGYPYLDAMFRTHDEVVWLIIGSIYYPA
jgi:hypothetical protein